MIFKFICLSSVIKHFFYPAFLYLLIFMSGCNDISLTTGLNVRKKAQLGR